MDLTRAGNAIRLHPADNVALAVRKLLVGTVLPNNVTTCEPIPSGHKIAIAPIAPAEPVRKYGQVKANSVRYPT